MDGKLEKLRIESYTDPEYKGSPVQTFTVMFNPNSYTAKYAVEYDDTEQGRGSTGLPQRYKKTKPGDFSVEFVLDGTGASAEKADVSLRIEEVPGIVVLPQSAQRGASICIRG